MNELVVEGEHALRFIKGVLCLSYPLHTAKDKVNLRDKPINELSIPTLFVSGTKDTMCNKDLMENVLAQSEIKCFEIRWIENGDHSLSGTKATSLAMQNELNDNVCTWCNNLIK